MKEWKESALCQTPPSALCTNCLVKWRNGSIEMAERPMLPWPMSFPCETLCGSELWALGHSTAPDSSPVLSPITCGHRCWAFGTLLESENPNPSVSEPHPSVAQRFAQHQYPWLQQQKKKKAFKRRQAGTSLVVRWLQIHLPVQGVPSLAWEVIFSTQGLHPHLLLGERALYHWITKEALCLL